MITKKETKKEVKKRIVVEIDENLHNSFKSKVSIKNKSIKFILLKFIKNFVKDN